MINESSVRLTEVNTYGLIYRAGSSNNTVCIYRHLQMLSCVFWLWVCAFFTPS